MSSREHSSSAPPTTQAAASARGENQIIEVDAENDPVAIGRLSHLLRTMIERGGGGQVRCDVGGLRVPDLRVVDELARLQLTARRLGSSICLLHARGKLVELLEFTGLLDVLPRCDLEETA
jgi:hypothetical protein